MARKRKQWDPAHNAKIVHKYQEFMRHGKRLSDTTIRLAVQAIDDFLDFNKTADFRSIKLSQIIAYKEDLFSRKSERTGRQTSLSAVRQKLHHLKGFYLWLAHQPGYRSHVNLTDASYFSLSRQDDRRARRPSRRIAPTIEHLRHVIGSMPTGTDQELRDRAVIAFAILSGARIDAIASMRIRHVDLIERTVDQDGHSVRTKFRKAILTCFFPVGRDIEAIVVEWINHLRRVHSFGPDDPLFPEITLMRDPETKYLQAGPLGKSGWMFPNAARQIFRKAWENAGLPYHNPHSLRSTLTLLGQKLCRSPEEFKCWSQSLGHENVSTTLTSYGQVPDHRQLEVFEALRDRVGMGTR